MEHELLNEIEKTIKSCTVGPIEGRASYDFSIISDTMASLLTDCLEGHEITAPDWAIICANIQSGMSAAASKAIRILGVHLGQIT